MNIPPPCTPPFTVGSCWLKSGARFLRLGNREIGLTVMPQDPQDALTELNQRLALLQARDNPLDAEEFVRLYQERRALLKQLSLDSRVD